ncbi:MAG: hypothetical protein JNG88_06925 [Phycisphaerales bacterium]|nr:hypothetical protein [Phycisphaerales bacterium]
MLLTLIPLIGLVLADVPPNDVGAGPQPSPVPVSWELEFEYLDPRRIEVLVPGATMPEKFWYMVYTVRNNTGRTQRFFPTFELVTEGIRVIETDLGIHPLVFDAIRQRHNATHKYLVSPTKAIGDLRVGDDNAIESVAIWRADDSDVNSFRVFVAGLSGETAIVLNPTRGKSKATAEVNADEKPAAAATAPSDKPKGASDSRRFTLRKTLEIQYDLPGSHSGRTTAEPERKSVRWIMR